MNIFSRIEKQLDEKMRGMFAGFGHDPNDREMIEIYRAVLEQVTSRIQSAGRGRRVFPFNQLTVRISAETEEKAAQYEALFADPDQLRGDIRGALAEAGVDAPADLQVTVQRDPANLPGGFHISFGRREAAAPKVVEAAPPAKATLTVAQGKAERDAYQVAANRINIGRIADVLDDLQRMIRRNDIVFTDSAEGPNATVSRAHAHISWDGAAGTYRLFDDGSAYGTSIFRDGSLVHIPAGPGRGVALRSGDDIYIGQAHLRFELE